MPTLDEEVAALNPGDEVEVHFKDDYNGYDYTVTGVTTGDNEKYGNYLLVGPVFVREGNGNPSWGVASVTVVKKATVPEPPNFSVVVFKAENGYQTAKRYNDHWYFAAHWGGKSIWTWAKAVENREIVAVYSE